MSGVLPTPTLKVFLAQADCLAGAKAEWAGSACFEVDQGGQVGLYEGEGFWGGRSDIYIYNLGVIRC